MSKSVGNTVSPEEMLTMARAGAVRYFLGQAHYRSQLDYHPAALEEANSALERIEACQARAAKLLTTPAGVDTVPEQFGRALEVILNVAEALAVLNATVRSGNSALDSNDSDTVKMHLSHVNTMVEDLGLNSAKEHDARADSVTHRVLET